MKPKDLKKLVNAGHRMYESGLVTGALGSIGVRLPSGEISVTVEGSRVGFLGASDLIVLNGQKIPERGHPGAPDRDAGIFRAVLASQPEAGTVIRVYSPYATALAFRGRKLVDVCADILGDLGGVAFVPFYRPGTTGLAGAVAGVMRENRIAIIENQGPVVWGTDIDDAVDRAEALEAAAKVIFLLGRDNGIRG